MPRSGIRNRQVKRNVCVCVCVCVCVAFIYVVFLYMILCIDRIASVRALDELMVVCPERKWRLVEVRACSMTCVCVCVCMQYTCSAKIVTFLY
jgi:hypothetical protein